MNMLELDVFTPGSGILIFLTLFVILQGAFMIGLWLTHRRQKHINQTMQVDIDRLNKELTALCAAAVAVDRRIFKSVDKIEALRQHTESAFQENPSHTDIGSIIERVQQGADSDVLVKEFNCSREEAELYITLHANTRVKARSESEDNYTVG